MLNFVSKFFFPWGGGVWQVRMIATVLQISWFFMHIDLPASHLPGAF